MEAYKGRNTMLCLTEAAYRWWKRYLTLLLRTHNDGASAAMADAPSVPLYSASAAQHDGYAVGP